MAEARPYMKINEYGETEIVDPQYIEDRLFELDVDERTELRQAAIATLVEVSEILHQLEALDAKKPE